MATDGTLIQTLVGQESDAAEACDAAIEFMKANGINELTIRLGETKKKGRGTRAQWITDVSVECKRRKASTAHQLTESQSKILRHALGAAEDQPSCNYGYRNYFSAESGSMLQLDCLALVHGGLMTAGRADPGGNLRYYHATREGCEAIGLHKAAINRAFKK